MLNSFWALVPFVIFFLIDLFYNRYLIKNKKPVNHSLNALCRLCFFIPAYYQSDYLTWFYVELCLFFLYWFLFDWILNLSVGWPFDNLGNTSKMDRFQRKLFPPFVLFVWKGLIALFCFLCLFFSPW